MEHWEKNDTITLTISAYTADGFGIGKHDGLVVFVPNTVRGEVCTVKLLKVKKTLAWGRVEEIICPSPARITPDCPHFPKCGGCQYRHMSYTEELGAKQIKVQDALLRIGGISWQVPPVLGAADTTRYRNKIQFPVSAGDSGAKIGFYRARSHDVIDLDDCLLQPTLCASLQAAFRSWMAQYDIPAYCEETDSGLIRHFYLRTNAQGECICCIVAREQTLAHEDALVAMLRETSDLLKGIVLNVNDRDTNVILGDSYRTLWGDSRLVQQLCGLSFHLSVPSFFQVNLPQTEKLYETALEFAKLSGKELVLDLYCGVGSISLFLAGYAGKVLGAEIVPQAVVDARENANTNGITNAEFFCGDAADVARKFAKDGLSPHVIVVDPPRKGLGPDVPEILAGMTPERIVYVSCDCATLARDVAKFRELGYQLERVQAVDLFPRTSHVETVCLLSKLHADQHIEVELKMDEMDLTAAESKATYEEIKAYVKEQAGLQVSNLYIAQVKQKCDIIERVNYNLPKSENSRQPKCPPEKEAAIREALEHFHMI